MSDCQTLNWQTELAQAISDPAELCAELELDATLVPAIQQASHGFNLRVPRGFVKRMRKGDLQDPLLLQVLPRLDELQQTPGFTYNPLLEDRATPLSGSGLLHKYQGRVLLIMTGACAINCRYCFRRHFPYSDNHLGVNNWKAALDYIVNDTSITEVILSGGDPLILKDKQLQQLIQEIEKISHVKRLRIHTRMPIVIPERITEELILGLTQSRLQMVLVVHVNHANEIDDSVKTAISRLRQANLIIFNQAVLLRGINDTAEALMLLNETLFSMGIIPYYLHLLDKTQGTMHFEVDEAKAKQLLWEVMQKLPGYMVPKLVREQPGAPAKLPIPIL